MPPKLRLIRTGTEAQKKELTDYGRSRNLEPSIENQRVYRKVHPGDAQDLTIEIKPGNNRFNVETFSK
jgi:hypothetical protein